MIALAATSVMGAGAVSVSAEAAGAAPRSAPDLAAAVHYLATTRGANGVTGGTSLGGDGYYEAFAQFGDFGLTLDGAFALAATRTDNTTL